ncbi:S1 family peptidase [Chengkuizengella marina]|uniref:Uncharacterized protein n=1 Tax=Chengkuizengella marina TaxID=2507566 RepID=A0A6N9Q2H8_9BACL|nr:S1 family peptidase [Chengkuizengella marina]NBI28990.1 hypothetical protein [Chengkuizengella marina]
MKSKKIVSFLVAVLLVVSIVSGSVYAEKSPNDELNVLLIKESKALKINKDVKKKVKDNKKYEDDYAGVYIDDDGILNINLVNNVEEVSNLIDSNEVKYNKVKNSFKKLDQTMKFLTPRMNELGITSLSLDEMKNKVVIYLKQPDEKAIKKINKLVEKGAVEIQEQKLEVVTTADIINGSKAVIGGGALTVGFAAKDSSGNEGFVTAGHLSASTGSSAKINNKTVGTLQSKKFGSSVDAAFVKAQSGIFVTDYTPTKKFTNGNVYEYATTSSSDLVQGKTIYAYGQVSGKQTGKILVAYHTEIYAGKTMTNIVKSSYKAIKGDSGAAVATYLYKGSGSADYVVMGVQSASALTNGNWTSDSYTLFTRVDKIFSSLGLSNP